MSSEGVSSPQLLRLHLMLRKPPFFFFPPHHHSISPWCGEWSTRWRGRTSSESLTTSTSVSSSGKRPDVPTSTRKRVPPPRLSSPPFLMRPPNFSSSPHPLLYPPPHSNTLMHKGLKPFTPVGHPNTSSAPACPPFSIHPPPVFLSRPHTHTHTHTHTQACSSSPRSATQRPQLLPASSLG